MGASQAVWILTTSDDISSTLQRCNGSVAENYFRSYDNYFTMATTKYDVPIRVTQLESPPHAKTKVPGIQDPPGFAPGASGSKA